MKKFLKDNGLSLVLIGLFLLFLFGHSLAGYFDYNDEQREHHQPEINYGQYLVTGEFLESVAENWESEFLQMGAFVIFATHLYQRGSSESKDPDTGKDESDEDPRKHRNDPDAPWPVKRGGWVLKLYEYSLSLGFLLLFLISFVLHAVGGVKQYNAEQILHGQPTSTFFEFLGSAKFWYQSMQNWQSEFLAIASMVILSVFLRQRGSPESKPVAASSTDTGDED